MERLVPTTAAALPLHDADHVEHHHALLELKPGATEICDGQPFVIHYRDAKGAESIRRISVLNLKVNDECVPVLLCHCFARDDWRCFRMDRILAIADNDGVLIEPMNRYWLDVFGIVWPPFTASVEQAALPEATQQPHP